MGAERLRRSLRPTAGLTAGVALGVAAAACSAGALAAEAAPSPALPGPAASPPAAAQAAHQPVPGEGLRSRLLGDEPSAVRALDPAVFLEISPVAASEPALRLPEDQRETR
jgi:hypothetical protein